MREKLLRFFLMGCRSLEEAEKELDRSIEIVRQKTGLNTELSLQKLAEEIEI